MKRILLLFLISVFVLSFSPQKRTWLAIGDSITYLNNHQKETDNRISKGYMTMVTDKIPDISFINKGLNGWTAVRYAIEIDKVGLVSADIFTIFLGTNDW